MSKYQEAFNEANDYYKVSRKTNKTRIDKFLSILGDTEENRETYHILVKRMNKNSLIKKHGSLYHYQKANMYRYQKTEKYKAYRRKYEAGYRQDNKNMVRYNSWKSTTKKNGTWTVEKEVDYLLKRM